MKTFFFLVKLCCLFIFIEYEEFFKGFMKKNHYIDITLESMIITHCKLNEWADFLVKCASCILLDRAIITFSIHHTSFRPHRLKYNIQLNNKKPILIGFFINHFVPILQIKEDERDLPFTFVETDVMEDCRPIEIDYYENV